MAAGTAALLLAAGCGEGTRIDADALAGISACSTAANPVAALAGTAPGGGGFASDLWGVHSDGRVTRLTGDGRSSAPAMFPGGDRVLFARGPGGEAGGAPAAPTAVWSMTLRDRRAKQVFDAQRRIGRPAVSPDGSSYAVPVAAPAEPHLTKLHVGSVAGGTPAALVTGAADAGAEHSSPAWSPDGQSVGYVARHLLGPAAGRYEVRVASIGGGTSAAVFTAPGSASVTGVTWSPDGATLLVTLVEVFSLEAESVRAVEVDVATGASRRVLDAVEGDLVYADRAGTRFSAALARPEDGSRSRLLTWSENERRPARRTLDVAGAHTLSIATCSLPEGGSRD